MTRGRDEDLVDEVERLRARLLALADDDSAVTRDTIGHDLDVLVRDLRAAGERGDAEAARLAARKAARS